MAGHSKWAQIKHKKSISDEKKGKLFSKLIREITVAAKEWGVNPDLNPRLRQALERARSLGLGKDKIDRALERVSGDGESSSLYEVLYEAATPEGVTLLIEGITDNKNRALAEIKHILSDQGARLAPSGSLLWKFEKIGAVIISASENQKSREALELAIIESGARDFEANDDTWIIETDPQSLEAVKQNLEKGGITVKEAKQSYKPLSPAKLSPEKLTHLNALIEKLLDHDDIQNVYTDLTP